MLNIQVFRRRRQADEREQARFGRKIRDVEKRHGGSAQEMASRIPQEDLRPVGRPANKNKQAAQALKERLAALKRKRSEDSSNTDKSKDKEQSLGESAQQGSVKEGDQGSGAKSEEDDEIQPSPEKRMRADSTDDAMKDDDKTEEANGTNGDDAALVIGEGEDEEEVDEDLPVKDEEEEEFEKGR